MKLHLNESLFESWGYKSDPETVSELIGSKVVYHATYKPYWEEIKKEGFIKPGKHQNWSISQSYIYLSKDYYNALSYAETAEDVPEELLNQIVVLEIDADKLDVDHLDPDHNQVYDYDGEVQLEDPLTWVELQYDLPIPVSAVKKVHDESELDEAIETADDLLDYIKSNFNISDYYSEGQSYILPDGEFLNLQDGVHIGIDDTLYNEGLIKGDPYFSGKLVLIDNYNSIRISDGKYVSSDPYVELPKKLPTNAQLKSLLDFLDSLNDKSIWIGVRDNKSVGVSYNLETTLPEQVIKNIKRFYSSGILYESVERIEESIKPTHHQMTYYNAKAALQNYILKYGKIDGPFELYYNFRLTPDEIKDILSYALDNKMIDEYQKDQILNNLGIKEDQVDEAISVPGVPDKPTAQDKFRYYWEIESRAIKQPEDLLRKFKNKFPNQYDIWGETFEWMLEHNEKSFIEPQNYALYLEYDLDINWGYIAIVEFKDRYQESLNEATLDITSRLNKILDKIDSADYTPDDYEAAIYSEVANELRPAGYNNDTIQKVVDIYIAQQEERLQTLTEVYPQKNESKSDFINRFMRVTAEEYPDVKQRYAIALSYWNKKNLKEDFKTDLDFYIAGGYSIKDFSEDTQDFINSHTQITTWPLYRFDSLISKNLTLGSEIQLDDFKSFSMSEKGRDRVWEDIQENEKDTSNYCLLKTSGRVRCFNIKKYSSNTNYSYQDEVLARGRFKIIKIDEWKGVLQYTITQSNDQMSEAYLDPEEKFWDYRTKEVDGDQYIDETRNEISWVRDLLDDPEYYEQRKGYTARIVEMTPEEYFKHCAELFGNSVENQKRQTSADKDTLDHLTQVITKYKKRFPIPFINIKDRTQEGRHRMYVLGELLGWDKKFPVLIIQDINNVRVPGKEIK